MPDRRFCPEMVRRTDRNRTKVATNVAIEAPGDGVAGTRSDVPEGFPRQDQLGLYSLLW